MLAEEEEERCGLSESGMYTGEWKVALCWLRFTGLKLKSAWRLILVAELRWLKSKLRGVDAKNSESMRVLWSKAKSSY